MQLKHNCNTENRLFGLLYLIVVFSQKSNRLWLFNLQSRQEIQGAENFPQFRENTNRKESPAGHTQHGTVLMNNQGRQFGFMRLREIAGEVMEA